MAEASELPVTLHDCTGPVVFAASCALSATLPNVNYQEAVRAYFTGWYREIVDALPWSPTATSRRSTVQVWDCR